MFKAQKCQRACRGIVSMVSETLTPNQIIPWNKGKPVGQKAPLKPKDIWAIRVRLQLAKQTRDMAMFNLAISRFWGISKAKRRASAVKATCKRHEREI